MTIPKLTPYTGQIANPDGSQTQTEFTQNMFDQLSYEAQLATQLDATIDGMNQAVAEVESDAASASASALSAEVSASSAGYQGLWPNSGGSALKGETWQTQTGGVPTGEYYTALQNTSVNPVADNTNWRTSASKTELDSLIAKSFGADTHIEYLGVANGSDSDSRSIIYGSGLSVYVPKDFTFRCNLLPDDDVSIFKGLGSFTTTDQWGNTHAFDIAKANGVQEQTASGLLKTQSVLGNRPVFGVLGDSISDGRDSTGWTFNPVDGNGDLSSTNYNHDVVGAPNGWVSWFKNYSSRVNGAGPDNGLLTANASSSGKKLFNGWAYRNFDYGFFQNNAYSNTSPDVLLITMGHNDWAELQTDADLETYLFRFEQLIKKAKGYGSIVAVASVSKAAYWNRQTEAFKDSVSSRYNIEYFDLGEELVKQASMGKSSITSLFGTSFDFTHPKDAGHRCLGFTLLNMIYKDSFVEVDDNSRVIPFRTANFDSYDSVTRTHIANVTESLSAKTYQLELAGFTRSATSSGNVIYDFAIYCTGKDVAVNVIQPNRPSFGVDNGSHRVEIHNTLSTSISQSLAENAPSANGYLVNRSVNLDYGVNFIRVIYFGTGISSYAPILTFDSSKENIGSLNVTLQSLDNGDFYRVDGLPLTTDRDFYDEEYSGGIGFTPDVIENTGYGYMRIKIPNEVGLRFWFGRKNNISEANGRYFFISALSTFVVNSGAGVTLDTFTSTSTDDFLDIEIEISSGQISITFDGETFTYDLQGGGFYIQNNGSSIPKFNYVLSYNYAI